MKIKKLFFHLFYSYLIIACVNAFSQTVNIVNIRDINNSSSNISSSGPININSGSTLSLQINVDVINPPVDGELGIFIKASSNDTPREISTLRQFVFNTSFSSLHTFDININSNQFFSTGQLFARFTQIPSGLTLDSSEISVQVITPTPDSTADPAPSPPVDPDLICFNSAILSDNTIFNSFRIARSSSDRLLLNASRVNVTLNATNCSNNFSVKYQWQSTISSDGITGFESIIGATDQNLIISNVANETYYRRLSFIQRNNQQRGRSFSNTVRVVRPFLRSSTLPVITTPQRSFSLSRFSPVELLEGAQQNTKIEGSALRLLFAPNTTVENIRYTWYKRVDNAEETVVSNEEDLTIDFIDLGASSIEFSREVRADLRDNATGSIIRNALAIRRDSTSPITVIHKPTLGNQRVVTSNQIISPNESIRPLVSAAPRILNGSSNDNRVRLDLITNRTNTYQWFFRPESDPNFETNSILGFRPIEGANSLNFSPQTINETSEYYRETIVRFNTERFGEISLTGLTGVLNNSTFFSFSKITIVPYPEIRIAPNPLRNGTRASIRTNFQISRMVSIRLGRFNVFRGVISPGLNTTFFRFSEPRISSPTIRPSTIFVDNNRDTFERIMILP